MFWSDGMQKLIMKIHDEGYVTRHSQDFYDSIAGFYLISRKLRNKNIIEANGTNKKNRKKYILTERMKNAKTFETECPECNEKCEIEVSFIDALKILKMFCGDWNDNVEGIDDGKVRCKSCGETFKEDEPILECSNCGETLKR